MMQLRRSLFAALLLLTSLAATAQETPGAPAVVLFKKGTFSMLDPKTGRFAPSFTVEVRRKILTEEGKKYGEVAVFHSKQARLLDLQGKTILADGREIPLPKDAIFKRRTSRSEKQFVSSVVFPGVEVGAVLEYRYRLRTFSLFALEPWYFQEELPTVYSEVIYDFPSIVVVRSYISDPLKLGIQQDYTKTLDGGRIWAWGRDLPAILDEPFAAPFEDLSSWFLLVPVTIKGIKPKALLESWATVCDLVGDDYERALKKSANAGRKAQELAGSASDPKTPRAKAEAVYRFVRDQIETEDLPGVFLPEDTTADSVLAARRGDPVGKALLLQAMLQAAGAPGRAVWASDRDDGRFDASFPNPRWFDRVLVAVDLDGQRVFLDPSDRDLAFGHLAPGLEGMPALLYDRTAPQLLTLPETPYTDSVRRAKIDLEIDGQGRLAGRGSLKLTGNDAWRRLGWKPTVEETTKAWKDWLAESYKDFTLADVKVKESVDEQTVEVAWSMAQREEEVLGDEVSLSPSLPLGPVTQPFRTDAASRISPVLFSFADRDEVELTVRWPEGWTPETLPREIRHDTAAGALLTTVAWADGERSLTFRRQLDVKHREFAKAQYPVVQALFARAERADAEKLVLVRK
jgi:transglutaminase-like putative cysteine protease